MKEKSYIIIGVDVEEVRKMLRKLEPKEQNKALKQALKATSQQARERLAKKAQAAYTVKNAGFKREMRIRSVSGASPSTVIHSEGEPLPLKDFKVAKTKKATRVQVVKSGSMKELRSIRNGAAAFINNIARKGQKGKNGNDARHIAVAQREGEKRLKINEKFSNSIPVMIGSRKNVYGIVKPHIASDLQTNLSRFVDRALGG